MGISKDDCERVLERMARGASAPDVSHTGLGLGLSIVASIAAAHGGRVTIDSTKGVGSRIAIRIPLVKPLTEDGNDENEVNIA